MSIDLLTSAMLRECLSGKFTFKQQVDRFKLNNLEQDKLLKALINIGYNYV